MLYFLLTQAHVCFSWFSGTDKDYKISFKISITQAINPSLDELSYSTQTRMRPNSDVVLNLALYLRSSTLTLSGRVLSGFVSTNLTFFIKRLQNSLLLNTVHITGKLCHRAEWDTLDYFGIIVFPFIDHRQLLC